MIIVVWLALPACLAGQSSQTGGRLDSKIPPPMAAKYKNVRDAADWMNPKLLVRSEGIEVTSRSIDVTSRFGSGSNVLPVAELAAFLIKLPVKDWPYGRIVGASEIGLRSGEPSETVRISENHKAADRILKALGITVQWWPSAAPSMASRRTIFLGWSGLLLPK